MTTLTKPAMWRRGDRVAVVAPASPFDRDDFDAGISELEGLGLVPHWTDELFVHRRYVAGDAAIRAADLLRAWADADTAGVIAVRGGYGSAQLMSALDPGTIRRTPKAFVGYSDLTTLLTWLVGHCGVVAFHGPTVAGRLGRGAAGYDRLTFEAALMSDAPMGELLLDGAETLKRGEARGRLLGGTLTQLAAACGTAYALAPWDDTILLLEDVGERPYRLDRLAQQLRDAGMLRRVTGIVLGTFPRCDEPGGTVSAREVLGDAFADCAGPVIYGVRTGHVDGPAMTLPLGVAARLIAGGPPRLVIEEPAVSA